MPLNTKHKRPDRGTKPRHVLLPDHRPDVADDRCEDEYPDEKVDDDEQKFLVPDRLRRLPDRRQRQRGPVKAINVLMGEPHDRDLRPRPVHLVIHPLVSPEPDGIRNGEVEARVPVDDHQDVQNDL